MRKLFKCILTISLLIFANCSTYTFTYGSQLADQQKKALTSYTNNKPIKQSTIDSLENNLWIKMAIESCPCNLVIRHLCLLDLINNKSNNIKKINQQLNILGSRLYLEGYGYWLYVKPYLIEYSKKFGIYTQYIKDMDILFATSGYQLNGIGVIYPAPFGDIDSIPLENQDSTLLVDNFEMFPVTKKTLYGSVIEYNIDKTIIGLNTHIPSDSMTIIISDNVCIIKTDSCVPFPWYKGHDKKYANKIEELNDIFRNDRVNWIRASKWWKKYEDIIKE